MKSQKFWTAVSGVSGLLGVAAGAFGAHVIKSRISPEMMEIFRTGVFYQLIHTVVILVIALSGNNKFYKSNLFFTLGIILFSFSLYIYSITSIKFFAMITPIGGVSFLTGWVLIIIIGIKGKQV